MVAGLSHSLWMRCHNSFVNSPVSLELYGSLDNFEKGWWCSDHDYVCVALMHDMT
jgi:hypothetical protein